MGSEITAAIAAIVAIGTLLVSYLGLNSKASRGFVMTISDRLKIVEEGLHDCETRERVISEKLVEAYHMAADEVRRSAAIETDANILRSRLLARETCPLAARGECPAAWSDRPPIGSVGGGDIVEAVNPMQS